MGGDLFNGLSFQLPCLFVINRWKTSDVGRRWGEKNCELGTLCGVHGGEGWA